MAENGEKYGKNERSTRQGQQTGGLIHPERGQSFHPHPRRNDAQPKKDGFPRPRYTRSNPKDYSDFDLSQLKLDEPAPEVVSELPNGHGVTVVGTRLPNGEVSTRIKYDRHLVIALSHSPFSLAQPDNYPEIVRDMEELIPVYPRRYIPREFLPRQEATSCSSEAKSQA